MPPVPVPPSHVERLVKRWFPTHAVAVERMGSGGSTPVYRLVIAGETFYLRLAEEPGEDRQAEAAAHRLALAAGVSVPAILRFEAAPPELDRSAALTSSMPGIPLSAWSNPIPDRTIEAVAADLVRFNAIPVAGYGWIDGVMADSMLFAEHETRAAWVSEYRTAAESVIAAQIFAGPIASALSATVQEWCDLLPKQSHAFLAHGDFDPSHIYVDPVTGWYQGLIDLGEIRGADPLYDLGHLLAHAFDSPALDVAHQIIRASAAIRPIDDHELHLQAIAIATRALGIQLTRPANAYRASLITRLATLLASYEGR